MKILLTGFGPFGAVERNPSARIVETLEKRGLAGHELVTRVLPVSYRRAEDEITALLETERFDAALLLGVAAGSDNIRLELFGRSRSSTSKRDADGQAASGWVREGEKSMLAAAVTLRGAVRLLKESGVPARVSRSAGDYVCNHTYYAALRTIETKRLPTRCLFVHVPCDEITMVSTFAGPIVPHTKQLLAVEIMLGLLIGSKLSTPHPAPPTSDA